MKFGFSRTTISRVYRESGDKLNLRPRWGRTKIMQDRDQRRLTRIIKRDRRAFLPQIAADFNAGPSTNISVRTIQRNIIDMGFRSRRPTRVPLMTARHKALRLAWDRHWTVEDWKHVAWSDESRFQLLRADGRVRVWRQPHESMDPTCQQGTVQAGGGSVMVWGVCSWRDMGPLIRLDTTLTGDRYVSILSDHLHPFMSIVHSDGLGQFQQDNATPHTSRIVTKWLQEHSSDFRHFCWPLKSPDMNIIEHIWDALQRAVQISTPSYSYGFMDSPAGFMVSITSSTTSDISRVHATSCCSTSACSQGAYTILGRCTSFFGSLVCVYIYTRYSICK